MPRNVEDIRAKLNEHFPAEKLEQKNGMGYVPWDDGMRVANDIFGFENIDVDLSTPSKLEAVPCPDGSVTYGYSAVVRVSVTYLDEKGQERTTSREGQGFNELEFAQEKTGTRRDGSEYRIPPRAMIDASIKGAASGALLRALVLFGDAFGLWLYNKEMREAAGVGSAPASTYSSSRSTATASRSSSAAPANSANGDLGFRPSEAQMTYLRKAGYTDETIAKTPFSQWKADLDKWFDEHPKGGSSSTRKPAAARANGRSSASTATATATYADEDVDDIPF